MKKISSKKQQKPIKEIKKKFSVKKTVSINKKTKISKHKSKKSSSLEFVKFQENPIIEPKKENGWEAWQTFNPGAILLNDKAHFLYRAIGEDGVSRLGYAASNDGFIIDERLSFPVYEHRVADSSFRAKSLAEFNVFSYFSGGSWGGAEDSRIVRVGEEDTLYMIYTACDNGLRVALTSIKLQNFLNKKWKWKLPVLISPPGEVHKNWVIFPEKINGKYAILHGIYPKIHIYYFDSPDEFDGTKFISSLPDHGGRGYYDENRRTCWDNWVRGTGPPPIKTDYGWLIFYHAMNANDFSKYKVGAMLLDLDNPTIMLHRSKEPVLEPSEYYENNGFKPGVVYATGAIVKGGNLLVYYGASDNYVSVAFAPFEEFLNALTQGGKPKLSLRQLKKKK